MSLKEKVYNHCIKIIDEKINYLQNNLRELTESAANETKSTAGDKHETALAMLQIEQENTSRQLKDAVSQKLHLASIDINVQAAYTVNGSLLKTNKGYFFISVAIGKVTVDGNLIIALSPLSPLGGKLLKLKPNDSIEMNGIQYIIEELL